MIILLYQSLKVLTNFQGILQEQFNTSYYRQHNTSYHGMHNTSHRDDTST
jgi:hypothetical protein